MVDGGEDYGERLPNDAELHAGSLTTIVFLAVSGNRDNGAGLRVGTPLCCGWQE
jgi:hypothetical protein